MKRHPFGRYLPTLLIDAAALLVVWLVQQLSGADGDLNGWFWLAPLVPAFSLLRSFERAFMVNAVAVRRFHKANAADSFLREYATLFAAAVAVPIVAAVVLTNYYDYVLDTSSDSNNDLRVVFIWGIGYLLVPLVPLLLGWGTLHLIRKHYKLTNRQSWAVFLISLIPDLIVLFIAAILFVTIIVPLLEQFGEAVS